MSMTSSFHVTEGTMVRVYNCTEDTRDIVKLEDVDFNQIVIFGNEDMIKELHKKLSKHIKAEKKAGRYK